MADGRGRGAGLNGRGHLSDAGLRAQGCRVCGAGRNSRDRAEHRLDEGTFGRSVRSGLPIPDDRLEADPAAELTVEEAQAAP